VGSKTQLQAFYWGLQLEGTVSIICTQPTTGKYKGIFALKAENQENCFTLNPLILRVSEIRSVLV